MAKQKHSFEGNDYSDDWGEYKKTSKKKLKHREQESSWRYDKRKDYSMDDNYDNYEDDRKVGDW